jgi:hypothetical protein
MNSFTHQTRRQAFALLASISFLIGFAFPQAEAAKKPKPTSIDLIPTITSVSIANGQLVASGTATATVKGTTTTVPFSGVPVNLALAEDQSAAGACPILDLELGPITLDLLGLVVETSPICLKITAYEGGGLLGDLLCGIAGLLDGGLGLDEILSGQALVVDGVTILPGLTTAEVDSLLAELPVLLSGALDQLVNAVLVFITEIDSRGTCAILHLELGPLTLNLLGLEVVLDDCAGGPVIVDITAETGQGNLLGNLLCELLGGGAIDLGATLQNLLNQILGLLNQ